MITLTQADVPEQKHLLAQVSQALETSYSQLWYRFLDRVFSRSGRCFMEHYPTEGHSRQSLPSRGLCLLKSILEFA